MISIKNNKNKNIVRAGALVLVLIVGNGFLGGGSKWSNKEKNKFTDICINELKNDRPNYSKLVKKYCEYSSEFLSNRIKFKNLRVKMNLWQLEFVNIIWWGEKQKEHC